MWKQEILYLNFSGHQQSLCGLNPFHYVYQCTQCTLYSIQSLKLYLLMVSSDIGIVTDPYGRAVRGDGCRGKHE